MQILDTKTRLSLYEHYDLSAIDGLEQVDTSSQYDRMVFSVFDHWLNEKEACEKIILYDKESLDKDPAKRNIYYSYEDTFLKFYNALYEKYKIFIALRNFQGKSFFSRFDSHQEYIDIIKNGIREQLLFCIMIPDLNVIISCDYDFTHWINIKKSESKKNHKKIIRGIVEANNLYILT